MKSDWSDSVNGKDDQMRKRPIQHNGSSDWEAETEDQEMAVEPKVFTCGKGKFPLENWTSVSKGQGHNSQNDGHDISNTSFQIRDPNAERSSAVMAPINKSKTYPAILSSCKFRKKLANWTWVRLRNLTPKINNLEAKEQIHWQGKNKNADNKTLERPGDTAGSEAVEEEKQILSGASKKSEERQGRLEDLEWIVKYEQVVNV